MSLIEIKKDPSPRDLRWFGLLLPPALGILGAIVRWKWESPRTAMAIWGLALAFATAYHAVPSLKKPLYRGWMALTFPIGWTVSHLVLAASYYLVLAPIGLVLRLLGHDPLSRRRDPRRTTYWVEHQPGTDLSRYFRQF